MIVDKLKYIYYIDRIEDLLKYILFYDFPPLIWIVSKAEKISKQILASTSCENLIVHQYCMEHNM